MTTLKKIKQRFPEGCTVACAINSLDVAIVKHESLIMRKEKDIFFDEKGLCIYLYNYDENKFATIINPATENQLSKYHVECKGVTIDVYDVLKAFNVVNPATQHAIKKLLKGGERGFNDVNKDYQEAIESIERAIELNK
jgi:hypothetical protein